MGNEGENVSSPLLFPMELSCLDLFPSGCTSSLAFSRASVHVCIVCCTRVNIRVYCARPRVYCASVRVYCARVRVYCARCVLYKSDRLAGILENHGGIRFKNLVDACFRPADECTDCVRTFQLCRQRISFACGENSHVLTAFV